VIDHGFARLRAAPALRDGSGPRGGGGHLDGGRGGGGDFTSIQAAVDAAAAGDRVEIAPGSYVEDVQLDDKALTLLGTGGAELTFLSPATAAGPALAISDGEEIGRAHV
jgi:hypothetical protein